MQLHPVKASGWFNTDLTADERKALLNSGIVPVNDKLYDSWNDTSKIQLYRGGRGGGKSEFVFQKLVNECINYPYFKCLYGRKTFETVRDSCFATLVAVIEGMGLKSEFHYSTANTSSMIVTHIPTGNKFIPFGSDKPEKIKSIKDPTHIFCEEFIGGKDEFTFDDFKEIFPTLRTDKAPTQFIAAFNTHSVYTDHWVIKLFFPDDYTGDDTSVTDFVVGKPVSRVFVNFTDNYFIDQEEYRQTLWMASGGNQRLFEGMANGAWGVMENDRPWLYNFDHAKHTRETLPFMPTYPVYLSFDFNNDPFGCTAYQMSPQKGGAGCFIHIIKEFTGKMKLDEMCMRIKTAFPASIFYVTGDRSGNNEDLGRNQSLYKMIGAYLQISDKNMNLNTTNLEHADSRYLCNTMFYHYPNLLISRTGCPNLIKQCEIARIDDKSKKPHHLLKDREVYKMDEFDSMRYFFQTYFNTWVTNTYINALKSGKTNPPVYYKD